MYFFASICIIECWSHKYILIAGTNPKRATKFRKGKRKRKDGYGSWENQSGRREEGIGEKRGKYSGAVKLIC